MNRKAVQCRGCISLRGHTTKSLLKDKRGEGEYIFFLVIFIPLFFFFVLPAMQQRNNLVSMTVEGTVTNIEVSYGKEDSTLITFNNNKTINFNDRIPNIFIGKSYIITYDHYESGLNHMVTVQSLKENVR